MSYYGKYDCGSPQTVLSLPIRGQVNVSQDVGSQPRWNYVADKSRPVYQPPVYHGQANVGAGFRPHNSRNDYYELD